MAQITDLNVSPYYDDFDEADNFHKVLFRPGFAIQARELTQLQSILQNQVERHGNHMFKEGSIVIPGQLSYSNAFPTLQLASSFADEEIDPSQFYDSTNPVTITGVTSGVKAYVIGYQAATATTQPILYLNYYKTGSDNSSTVFSDGENITADKAITHTTGYASGVASATTFATDASQTGSSATIEDGVIYIRGQFVKVNKQTLLLSSNSSTETTRVGLTITETLVTPEVDGSLTDNSRGSSNYAAKGAHRLKISLTLAKLATTSTEDSSFIEMMRIDSGTLVSKARTTEYSVLGDVLARRTHDESGDYTVKPFLFGVRESITNTVQGKKFTGAYTSGATTDDGGTASEDLLALSCSAGKAYVRGYEYETLGTTFKDLNKARDVKTINAGVTNLELGNFVRITNLYNTPDIGSVSGETTPYKQVKLFSGATVTRGTVSSEEPVGVARVRALEYDSGVSGTTSAVYKAFLFDVRTFTVLTLSDTPSPLLTATHSTGVKITGNTSGATGLLFDTDTSSADGHRVRLTNVVGTFQSGEKLIASDSAETSGLIENSGNTDLTVTLVTTRAFSETRQMFMDDADSGQDFTADIELTKVRDADLIALNATDASLANANDNILLEEDGTTELGIEPIKEAVLVSPEKNVAIYKLPKTVVKTLLTDSNNNSSDTSYTIRRQFVATSNSSGVVTLSAGSNEVFGGFAEADYVMSILTAGDGTGVQGDLVPISGKISGTGTASITITDDTILGDAAKVKVIATIVKSSVASKLKTTNLSKQVKVVASDADGAYGCRATDKEISLGRADAFRLQAVFDSEDTSSDATAPTLTLGTVTGTFVRGEKITGSSSGAEARIITTTSPIQYVLTAGFGATDFTTSDTITGESSSATSTVSTVTAGSKVVTSNFTLDTGQRDNFYDIARIVRKSNAEKPLGRLLVVFDFFSHSTGDFFSVDSYSAVGGQMEYDDIPTYSATKIDPDDPKPSGVFPLRDCLDFRPTAENITGASDTLTAVDTITATASSFDFTNRQFDGTGAIAIDTPKINNALTCDFEHYLPRRSVLYIGTDGEFKIVDGVPAEDPQLPTDLDNAMKLATISVPAYTFTPDDVIIKREQTQRFTMRDIGKLQDRIENLEYYTSLNLLERDAESLQISDVNGLNRFKSGFVVDNFAGHRVGDTLHPDYKIAIDMENRELRPKCVMKAAKLVEKVTTDSARTTAGYQKTGDLLTLPYTEKDFITQPYATRPENIQSALIYEYVGKITLTPGSDEWFETEVAPALIINVDGNFDAVTSASQNQLGTVWNAWETQWSGVVVRGELGRIENNNLGSLFRRQINTVRTDQERTGTRTRIVEQVENQVISNRVISQAAVPFVRPRTITGVGECFRPNTRLYAFFDNTDVNVYVTPSSTSYSTDTTLVEGSPLVTDTQGKVEFSFRIPEYRFAGQQNVPKFKSGDVGFRLTSSSTNVKVPAPSTVGAVNYAAKGIVNTTQQTIESTRNATVVQDTVTQTQSITSSVESHIIVGRTGVDPLAQTFRITETGGCFIPSVDLFFSEKDTNLPVWVELREVINGYPGPTLVPFGRKVLNPNDVNVDATTGSTATNFKFDSPVYLKEGVEYCLVAMTNSLNYKVWIAGLGEQDVSGSNRIISTQPHLGSLFKSQNNTTWSAVQSEDLKFTMKKCNFTSGSGTVTLQNDNIGDSVTAEDGSTTVYGQRLKSNPIVLTNGSTVVRVNHADHGMYSTSNNVTITGVSSGISTTLNGAITASGTSVTLTSNTNFPSSGTVHIKIDNEIMSGTISGSTISSITRGQGSTTAVAHSNTATVELYMISSVPLTEINKTHTAIANIGIDSYTVASTTSASISGASTTAQVGGISVYATENYRYETVKTLIGAMELPGTTMTASIKTTNATSPDGTETSFGQSTSNTTIPLNENFDMTTSSMVASGINETNEMSGSKSLEMPIVMTSQNSNLSPVIDLDRRSFIAIGNRINNVDSSSDVFPTTDYVAPTEPDGDQNSAIYLTKAVTLEQSASAIRVVFSAHKQNTSEIQVMFKTLRTSDSSDFDDIGYEYFNTDGSPDNTVPNSLVKTDFQEYVYTAGVNDDGVGAPLDEFIQFQIKIIMQGTDATKPVRIKDLRAIALAT